MAIEETKEEVKSSTPKRLTLRRDEQVVDASTVPSIFGTRRVEGRYVSLRRDKTRFLFLGEVDGSKFIRQTEYDPAQVTKVFESVVAAVRTYRSSLGISNPVATKSYGAFAGLPPLKAVRKATPAQDIVGFDPIWTTQNETPITSSVNFFAREGYPESALDLYDSLLAFLYTKVFNFPSGVPVIANASDDPLYTGSSLTDVSIYDAMFGFSGVKEYSLEHLAEIAESKAEEVEAAVAVGLARKSKTLADSFLRRATRLIGWFAKAEERLLQLSAVVETAYYNMTQLPTTEALLDILTDALDELQEVRKVYIYPGRRYVTTFNNALLDHLASSDPSNHPYLLLFRFFRGITGSPSDASLGLGLRGMIWQGWESIERRMKQLGIVISNSSLTQNFYTGVSALCEGEVDRIYSLRLDNLPLQQTLHKGNNEVYAPLLYGGFEGGVGGIGSLDNKNIIVQDGDALQASHRHIASIVFEEYNLGGGARPPEISGLVSRISKLTDGDDQWLMRYATVTTLLPPRLADNHYVNIVSTSLDNSQRFLQYLQRLAFKGVTARLNGSFLSAEQLQALDFYKANWEADLPAPDGGGTPAGATVSEVMLDANTNIDAFISIWLQDDVPAGALYSPQNLASIFTINPIHAIRELLTYEGEWGINIDPSRLDIDSWAAAARTCYEERLGCSIIREQTTEALFKMLRSYVNGEVFYDANSDSIKIKLIRDDFTEGLIPLLNESNVSNLTGYQRNYNANPVSRISLSYKDYQNKTQTVAMTAPNFDRQAAASTIAYPCCPDELTALRVASRELAIANNSPLTFSVVVDAATAGALGIGDPVRVTWPPQGITDLVMRVVSESISEQDVVSVKLIEDIFAPLDDILVKGD